MKAISLTQPWAVLAAYSILQPSGLIVPHKRFETRSWATKYRGPLAIHAAKTFPAWARRLCYREPFYSALRALGMETLDDFPLGAVLAKGYLLDCIRITAANTPEEPERSFGDYTPGRYMFKLDGMTRLSQPVPTRGALGLWEWQG